MALRVLLLLVCCLLPMLAAEPAAVEVAPATTPVVAGAPAVPPVVAAPPITAFTYSEVVIENHAARVVISTQRASLSRFELKGSHPIALPKHLHRNDAVVTGPGDDGKPALAVLAPFVEADTPESFRWARNQHNLLVSDRDPHTIWGIGKLDLEPWTVAVHDATSATLTWDNGHGLAYAMTYRMHATLPQVAVECTVRNHGGSTTTLYPSVDLLRGIHQDYAPNEVPYLTAFIHQGGVEHGEIHKAALSDRAAVTVEKPLKAIAESGTGIDFVGLKSRFFSVWWTPGTLTVDGVAATATTPVGGSAALAPVQAAEPAGPSWRADALSFISTPHQDHQGELVVSYGATSVPASGSATLTWTLTASGMTWKDLGQFGPAEQRIELTDFMHRFFIIFTRPLVWVLDQIVKVVPSYALAVILLTLMVKALLFRLTWAQHSSMMKMQKLAPELKYLQEQYKNDRAKLGQKQMELWKKNGVNPVGGCLPLLIQIPIFIALYNGFQYNADMRGATFLWVSDLTLPDQVWGMPIALLNNWMLSVNPLPLIYIAVTVWMSLTSPLPTGGDPQQEQMAKTMRWMPVLFGVIFYNMPAGLVLYFTVNAILSTLEVKFIRRRLAAKK